MLNSSASGEGARLANAVAPGTAPIFRSVGMRGIEAVIFTSPGFLSRLRTPACHTSRSSPNSAAKPSR